MGHRICIMNKGEVVQIGKPLEVYRNPVDTFVARFLGNPPMNLLPAKLELASDRAQLRVGDDVIALPTQRLTGVGSGARHEILLGIRPEDLYEAPRGGFPQLSARIVAVEPLGAETLLVFTIEGSAEEAIARVGRETRLHVGDHASLYLDSAAIHLFDPATGSAIARDEP
jgi:multiple sugar transport system ATP-binding protein